MDVAGLLEEHLSRVHDHVHVAHRSTRFWSAPSCGV